jgi:hypothetical protein
MGDALLFRLKVIGGAFGFILIGGLIYWFARLTSLRQGYGLAS